VTLSCPPFAWTPLAGRREFKVVIRRDKNGSEQRLPEPLAIEVLPGPPNRLEATLPCTHRPGDALSALVTLRDRYDNRASWEGMVDLWDGRKSHSLAVTGGRGTCTLSALSESAPARVHASAGALDLDAASNPSLPTSGLQFYVGDLHCHDYLSEAEGAPDEVMRWAWEERRLDFCSLVPQAHGWLDNETWTLAKHTAERFLREGQFVTLLGFEWQHSGYGDKVVHYLGGDQPYLPPDDERYDAPRKLYAALRASDALVIGHHPGYPVGQWVPGTDFGAVEDDVERLVELWSMHGSSEGTDPADRPLVGADDRGGVMAALRQGLRLGFVGGSDTHSGRPGGSAKEPRPYWGGLAGVWAEGLTRRDLFGALRARRTVALTGARMVVRFTVNGAPMGAEIPACERVRIRVDAWTPGRIAQVQVLKNTRLVQTPDRSRKTCQVLDRECHLELEDAPGGPAFYHCRVVQDDGHLAVCSPVWVG